MWQEVVVYVLLALGMGFTIWGFYRKLTGKSSCCGGGCTCKSPCGSENIKGSDRSGHKIVELRSLPGRGSCCTR